MATAAARPEPIPVYGEMSSINPLLLLPAALQARGKAIARALVPSLNLGAGQFCTNPELLLAVDGPELDAFVADAERSLAGVPAATMLTPGIHAAYSQALAKRGGIARLAGQGPAPVDLHEAYAQLFEATAAEFLADPTLHEELFGPASLVVRCRDEDEMRDVLAHLEGQLTIAIHHDAGDHDLAARLLPLLERKAGRLLANGFGTGVEVAHAMVRGGPFPAMSDGRATSVGSLAIDRFLRPVCYQDLPDALLPAALRSNNPRALPRRVAVVMER